MLATRPELIGTSVSGVAGHGFYCCALGDEWIGASLNMIDTTAPTEWVEALGGSDVVGSAEDVAVQGDYAYVMSNNDGLFVVDVSSPATPVVMGNVDAPGGGWGIAVQGDHAYAAWNRGLRVIDITTPAAPAIVGSVENPHVVRNVAVQDGYAYLAAEEAGLLVVDIAIPDAPAIVGSVTGTRDFYDVVVQAGYAYLKDDFGYLSVVDISIPTFPQIVGQLAESSSYEGLAVQGDFVYLAGGPILRIVDVSDPEHPVSMGTTAESGQHIHDVVLDGEYAYVSRYGGCWVVDVTYPESPLLVGGVGLDTGPVYGVALAESGVCMANWTGGLLVIPRQCQGSVPVFLSGFDVQLEPGIATVRWGVTGGGVDDDFRLVGGHGASEWCVPYQEVSSGAFMAIDRFGNTYRDGLISYRLFLDLDGEQRQLLHEEEVELVEYLSTTRVLAPYPNPFNPRTTIAYEMPGPGYVRLQVFDVRGRVVRTLVDGPADPGRHETVWDGRDANGRELPSGSYLLRLVNGDAVAVERLMLMR